ncbi:sugar ABC transporter ATP-binding protein [Arthrobacter sp. NPDC089319]|uniref:sugar ABC transporter ATP-binding protein n=1 Tax=Arthrobacter sp. NPDC089319 TaxID=3155915 RepID=UPI0034378CF7
MTKTLTPIVSLQHISKRFGSTLALSDVSLDLYPGEVHVLLGENGAGKSTLVKTILGTYQPDSGRLHIRGEEVAHHSPANARKAGINVVMQDFSLAPTLSVQDNLFLGRQPEQYGLIHTKLMRTKAKETRDLIGGTFALSTEAGALPRSEQQLVEIMKAVMGEPGVLVLDEPTAALGEGESERLFSIVERLTGQGWAILYITHRMAEIRRLGTRVTVLRDGKYISDHLVSDVSNQELVNEMVGREVSAIYPPKADAATLGDNILELDNVSSANGKVKDVSLTVRRGEIVAIAGLVGAGKGDVVRILSGVEKMSAGSVRVGDYKTSAPKARTLISHGVGYMSEDRKTESLALDLSVEDNLLLEAMNHRGNSRWGILSGGMLRQQADELMRMLEVRPHEPKAAVGLLSGGNQQKVVLARALTKKRSLLVVAEPTSGVDVGARQQIYAVLRDICSQGAGILLVSSDLEEVIGVADRVYVMNSGRITAELIGDQITDEAVVAGAFGENLTENLQKGA